MSNPSGPQQPPYGPPPVPPQPPKPGMSTGKKIGFGCGGCLGIFLILALMGGCMAALGGGETASPPAATSSPDTEDVEEAVVDEEEAAEEEPAEEEPTEESAATIGDGVHQVGSDIEPGIYTTDGPDPDSIVPMCYHARLSGLGGELDDIISNNNIQGSGTVEVSESDVALELSGGCEWTLQE